MKISTYLAAAAVLSTAFISSNASAQVSISLGAQSYYDDNIFLENGKDRPSPVTFNSDLQSGLPTGFGSLKNFNGKEDSDIVTNLYTQFSGKLPVARQSIDSSYNLRAGTIIFADFSNQNRFTLDGDVTTSLSKNVLPDPFKIELRNAIQSNSNNLAVASGTATQSSQNYLISSTMGINDVDLTRKTSLDLYYLASYQMFLGQFYLNKDTESVNTQQQGTDFHSHNLQSAVRHQVTKAWEVGVLGTGGVQLFTKIHEGAFGSTTQETEDLDRTNGQLQATSKYTLTKKFSFNGSAGLAYSKLMNDPEPRTISTLNEDGTTSTTLFNPKGNNTGLTYTLSTDYAYRPGALVTVGSTQGFSTNLDGGRFLTRLFFANIVESLTNDLQLTLGSRYIQFEDESETRPDTGRFEGSLSLNYHLSDSFSLNCGYNYSNQKADDSNISDDLRFNSPEYTSNRFFIGFTSGFVGLPL